MAEYRGLKSILRQFYLKIKERLDGKADKAHTHTPGDITGTLPIAKGGTGADNGQAAFDNIVSGVRSSSAPADSETMLFHSTSWYKATVLNFWEYIKGKISSVLGLSTDGLSSKGNITAPNNKYIRAVCADNDYVQIMGSGSGDAGSGEISTGDNGNEPLYARQRNASGISHEITLLDASGNQKFNTVTAKAFVGNVTGKADSAGTADKVVSTGNSGTWISGRSNAIVKTTTAGSNSGWKTLASIKTSAGSIETGNLSGEDKIRLVYSPDTNVSAGTNNVTNLLYIGNGSIEICRKLIATASGIRIPTSQPSSIANGDIWIE